MRNRIRIIVAGTALSSVLAGSGGIAFADDCFNASRSAQGNTSAAANSGNWWSLSEMLSTFLGLTPDQVAAVMNVIAQDPRIPANLSLFMTPSQGGNIYELAQNAPERLMVNGKGIDHSDDYPGLWEALDEDLAIGLGAS